MQCRGERERRCLPATVFFSPTHGHGPAAGRLVVMPRKVAGTRESAGAAHGRIANSGPGRIHEIRNVCGAISVIYENLVRSGALTGTKTRGARLVVETLHKSPPSRLKQSAGDSQIAASTCGTLDDLKIVLEPYCQEADMPGMGPSPRNGRRVGHRHSLCRSLNSPRQQRALEAPA